MWGLPSRGRPGHVRRFAWFFRHFGGAAPGVVMVDHDDPALDAYRALDLPAGWSLEIGDGGGLSDIWNAFFARHPDELWYGLLGDDAVPLTHGFERALAEAAGADFIAAADDGVNNPETISHCVIGGDLARRVGWLHLPGVKRLYADNAWLDIARGQNCLKRVPVKIEHWHFSNGRAIYDATYRKPDAAHDRAVYEAWRVAA